MVHLADRLCGQPVSWGINYLPGWGVQLSADQVLADMQRAGLTATEFQPGLFPADADAALKLFDAYSLRCVGGWAPLVLYGRPVDDVVADFEEIDASELRIDMPVEVVFGEHPHGETLPRLRRTEVAGA